MVAAYNNLMQYLYQNSADSSAGTDYNKLVMGYVAELLLEIRRSVGNEDTSLDKWAMLEWFIKDVSTYRDI